MPAVELGLGYYERWHNSFSGLGGFHYEGEGRYPVRYKCCDFISTNGKRRGRRKGVYNLNCRWGQRSKISGCL